MRVYSLHVRWDFPGKRQQLIQRARADVKTNGRRYNHSDLGCIDLLTARPRHQRRETTTRREAETPLRYNPSLHISSVERLRLFTRDPWSKLTAVRVTTESLLCVMDEYIQIKCGSFLITQRTRPLFANRLILETLLLIWDVSLLLACPYLWFRGQHWGSSYKKCLHTKIN